MTRRPRIWRTVAAVFTVGNFAGAVMAIVMGETAHAAAHVALMFGGTYGFYRFSPDRAQEPDSPLRQPSSMHFNSRGRDPISWSGSARRSDSA